MSEIDSTLGRKEAFVAQMQNWVAGSFSLRRLSRVDLDEWPDVRYTTVMGGGRLDRRSKWAASWRVRLLAITDTPIIKPVGPKAGERISPDARTTDGGRAAVAFFRGGQDEIAAFFRGKAEAAIARRLPQTNVRHGSSGCIDGRAAEEGKLDFVHIDGRIDGRQRGVGGANRNFIWGASSFGLNRRSSGNWSTAVRIVLGGKCPGCGEPR